MFHSFKSPPIYPCNQSDPISGHYDEKGNLYFDGRIVELVKVRAADILDAYTVYISTLYLRDLWMERIFKTYPVVTLNLDLEASGSSPVINVFYFIENAIQ